MKLAGKTIATLVAEGVEDLEYYVPPHTFARGRCDCPQCWYGFETNHRQGWTGHHPGLCSPAPGVELGNSFMVREVLTTALMKRISKFGPGEYVTFNRILEPWPS
jgi:hypothetical protein